LATAGVAPGSLDHSSHNLERAQLLSRHTDRGPTEQWRLNELVRRRRLRDDARRPLGVNLAEGLALTEFLSSFTGACRRR
jgi:hypothetical protein